MKAIQDGAAFFFIVAVAVLSIISVLGVWDFFARDVISKSFQTLGLLALVSIVVVVAGRYIDARHKDQSAPAYVPSPAFGALRKAVLAVLIMLAAILAFLGVMAIWDFIPDRDVLWKSIGSLGVLAFGAFIIVLTCLEREKIPASNPDGTVSTTSSNGILSVIVGLLVGGWVIMTFLGELF